MAKFCGFCGSQLDEQTGRCPNPNCKSNEDFTPHNEQRESSADADSGFEPRAEQAYAGENGSFDDDYAPAPAKKRGAMIAICVIAGVILVLGGIFALCYFDVINIEPVNSAFASMGLKEEEKETTEPETEPESTEESTTRQNATFSDALSLIDRDIEKAAHEIGNMKDERCTDGSTGYTNGSLIIETEPGSRKVSYVCITGKSEYRLAGISIGDDIENAQRILETSRYTLKNENSSGFRRFTNEAGDVICISCSKDEVEEVSYSKSQKKTPAVTTTTAPTTIPQTQAPSTAADSTRYSETSENSVTINPLYNGMIISTGDFDYSVLVSSELEPQTVNGKTFHYGAENLTDNDPSTCWAEGVDGAGEGEQVTLECYEPTEMRGLIINNGYCKNEKLYDYNNRLKDITIIFDDGSEFETRLKDGYENRSIIVDFGENKTTRTVTVVINSVYDGKDCNDTCVSDIRYFIGN